MSASLTNDLPSTVSAALDKLDETETRTHNSGQHSSHDRHDRHVGPFGVFESRVPLLSDENASIADISPQVSSPQIAGSVHGARTPVPTAPSACPRPSDRSFGTSAARLNSMKVLMKSLRVLLTRCNGAIFSVGLRLFFSH